MTTILNVLGRLFLITVFLMSAIGNVVPVLPIALMSRVMLEHRSEWLSELELKSRAIRLIEDLRQCGAPIKVSAIASEGVLAAALSMLEGRGFVEQRQGLLRARDESLDMLKYYANSIEQWDQEKSRPESVPDGAEAV